MNSALLSLLCPLLSVTFVRPGNIDIKVEVPPMEYSGPMQPMQRVQTIGVCGGRCDPTMPIVQCPPGCPCFGGPNRRLYGTCFGNRFQRGGGFGQGHFPLQRGQMQWG